jgi:hypothetical protein
VIQFERGQTPPNEWMRNEYQIQETWRVYDTTDNSLLCYLSPIRGAEIHSSQAIEEVMRGYIGDWHVSAELIRWDDLLEGQP